MKTRFTFLLISLLATFGMAQAQPVSYLWSNGATTPEIVVNPSQTTTYYVTITQNGQQYYDSLVVQVDSAAGLFAQDTLRGCGPLLSLFAPEGQWQTLAWSSGESSNSIQVAASGWYFLDATDTSGCTIRDSVFVSLFQVDLGEDKVICAGQSVTLSASTMGGAGGSATGLPANLQQGLVGYWPFNGNAQDASGNGNNGTVNGAMLTTDRFGFQEKAYEFTQDFIEIQPISSLSGAQDFTWATWVQLGNDASNGQNYIMSRGWDYSGGFNLWMSHTNAVLIANGFYSFQQGTKAIDFVDNWKHIVVTRQSGVIKFYIDGIIDTTYQYNSPIGSINENFYFGVHKWNGQAPGYFPYYFRGKIDDIGIWSRSLSPTEILQLYGQLPANFAWSIGETTPSINVTPAQTTTYYCTVTSEGQSCTDSVIIIVNQPSTGNISASINEGESYSFNGQLLTFSGTYNDTLVNAAGCDSLLTLTLTVIATPLSCGIQSSQSTLCAGQSATLSASASSGSGSDTGGASGSTSLPANLQQGLVGYFPLNGNAADASGNGNNGTVFGNLSNATNRFGIPDAALNFSGANTYILTGALNQSIKFKSFSAWVKLNNFSQSGGGIVGIQAQGGEVFDAMVYNETGAGWFFGSDFFNRSSSSGFSETGAQWVHLVYTYEPFNYKIYRNGQLIYVNNQYDLNTFPNSAFVGIGIRHIGPSNAYINATLDDIAIYNRALSAAEVQQLYNTNTSTYAWSTGETTPSINVTPAQTTTYTCTVTNGNQSCMDSVTVTVNQPSSSSITASINEGQSYSFNGQTLTQAGVYTDTLVNAAGCDSLLTLTLTVIPTPLNCGIEASQNTICAGQSATLTASANGGSGSASGLPANLQQGLVGYWPFNGNADDASGNGNNGTVNGATLTTDRFGNAGKAYSFDGVNDWIQVQNNSNLNLGSEFTLSVWINSNPGYGSGTPWNDHNHIISRWGGGGLNAATYQMNINSNGNIVIATSNTIQNSGSYSTHQNLPGSWYHVLGTYKNQVVTYYFNGVKFDSVQNVLPPQASLFDLAFGRESNATPPQSHVNGIIDDIAIYNRALSVSEIQQLYNQTNTNYAWSTGETTPSINIAPTQTTKYYCTVSDGNQSCTDSVTVTVNQTPQTPSITAGGPTSFCSGGSVTLSAPAGLAYLWSTGSTNQSITVNSTGSYSVQTISGSCTSAVSQATEVTVNQTPSTPSITAGGPTSFCDGGSVTLSAPQGFTYLWSNGSTNQSITVGSTGSYSVQTISGSCTSAVSQATEVTVNQAPQTPSITAGGPTSFCSGGSVTLSASAGLTYLWSNGSTNQSITVSSTGSYSVQTISGTCTSAVSQATQVTVNQAPQTPTITASGSTTFCSGGSVTLSAPAGLSYLWSNGQTTSSISVNSTGSYTVQTISNGCTSAVSQATLVTVNQAPQTPTITASGSTSFCSGGSVTLSAPAGLTYLWSNGSTNQSITVGSTGSYSVQTISGSCTSAVSQATEVTVNQTPQTPSITAGGPTSFCDGGLVTLSAPAGLAYLWSNGSTNQSITVGSTGSYSVQTISGSCTSAVSQATQVTLLPDPFSEFTYSLFGTEIQLNHQPASSPDSLRWNFGDGQTSTETNPLHFFETSGIFNICLTTYLAGCSSQTCKPVQISVTNLSGSSGAGVQVVPNPSRGMYELSIDNLQGTARIEVLDALGKLVYEGEVSSQGIKTRQLLDIRHVAMGVYTLRLQTIDGPKYLRLKKE
jgi:hypothetical protein